MKLKPIIGLASLLLMTALACKTGKYAASNKIYQQQAKQLAQNIQQIPAGKTLPNEWVGTVNFNLRKPNLVVIHYTAQDSVGQTLNTFTLARTQVSAHYVIGKDGKIIQMLNDYMRAWHAGAGKWGNITDVNSCSIGIELDNNGKEPFPPKMIENLMVLLDTLKTRYHIPTANFIGHADLAPGRKTDPGKYFPWKALAQKGFGNWYGDTLQMVPPNFEPKTALRIIGYDISNYNTALRAFKLHFFPEDERNTPDLDARECALLYDLYQKYL